MAVAERVLIAEGTRPKLPRHAKLRFHKPLEKWVILAPERVFELDDIASEVVRLCDGANTLEQVIDQLVSKYSAPRDVIAKDVVDMLQGLADKGFVVT